MDETPVYFDIVPGKYRMQRSEDDQSKNDRLREEAHHFGAGVYGDWGLPASHDHFQRYISQDEASTLMIQY